MTRSSADAAPHRYPPLPAVAVLLVYACLLLSIGLTADWRLRHEDNGAMHTTLALSHQRLGLRETRAHDVFVDRFTGDRIVYGHHPPGPPLVLAAAFTVTGRATPAVARLTVIAFHLTSLLLLIGLAARLLPPRAAVLAGFIMATVPMSSYFGRMVNYEAICLTGVMLQLLGYVRSRQGARGGLPLLAAGVVIGGLADWPAFFFAAALALVELIDLVAGSASRGLQAGPASRLPSGASAEEGGPAYGAGTAGPAAGGPAYGRILLLLVVVTPATFFFDLAHLWFAAGSVDRLSNVLALNRPMWQQEFTLVRFVLGQLDTFRRYFTDVGLIATVVIAYALIRHRSSLAQRLFGGPDGPLLRRLLAAAGLAALGYVLAAPRWAMAHQYWQFYFLPFVAVAMTMCWRVLRESAGGSRRWIWRAVPVVAAVEMLVASAYWLHFRHTREETYAIEHTAEIRERFLLPEGR